MQHCLVYHGGFERNFESLKPGAATFQGSSGDSVSLPVDAVAGDGVQIGYMEKAGKKFAAVRARMGKTDVVVKNELLLDGERHMSPGSRLGAAPTFINDKAAAAILEDMMAKNPDQKNELSAIRSTFSLSSNRPG